MILVITHKDDFTADYLINIMNNRKIPYNRLNCEDILATDLCITFSNEFHYQLLETSYSAVWFRRSRLPELPIVESADKTYILGEVDALVKNLFSIIDAKWVSDPFSVYRAENKLYQLKVAQQVGMRIPATLVTTSPQAVTDFYYTYKEVIVKPIARTLLEAEGKTHFIFTNKVSDKHIADIEQFDLTPCIFQELIPKQVELRVTVVGEQIFTAQVDSQAFEETKIDWRKKAIRFTAFDLPKSIAECCIQLVNRLGLRFGAIDMILSPDGSFTFLEINPNGQWVWIETETGLPIAEALLQELQ